MRMVLLRHDLPDGSSHFDWLIERTADGGGLLSFRVFERIDGRGCVSFRAELMADHRREYLDYQGPVSAGRGKVTRVASGRAADVTDREGRVMIDGKLGENEGTWRGKGAGEAWTFEFDAMSRR